MTLRNFSDFKLISCNDGREALELAEDITPDMVLLDVMMPNVDGLTVLNRLKELDAYRRVPIVLMTAKVQKHEVEQFKELGATDVIIKPFDPLTLVDRIVDIWNEYHGCF